MEDGARVLIVGGGPVGLTAAINLAHFGIPFTLFEAGNSIFEDPRAATVHPPTLEMFQRLGLTGLFIDRGYVVRKFQYRDRREGLVAEFDLGLLSDETPFPFRLMLEQHKISAIISDKLKAYSGVEILYSHKVIESYHEGEEVVVEVETPDGVKTFHGRFLIGCDGGRSLIRKSMMVEFEGFTFKERFLVVTTPFDFAEHGYAFTNYIADPEEWCALFKVRGMDDKGLWRVVFPTDPQQSEAEIFQDRSMEERLQGFHPKADPYPVVHRNLYEVHQRVATSYRKGQMLIAGDAAHVNNPLGGMGMNFGFHDAFNLAEKLARIWFEGAGQDLLGLYDRQRRTVAIEYLQAQSIQNKKNLEEKDPEIRKIHLDEMRQIAADRDRQRNFLMRAAMIDSIRRSATIT